MNVKKHNFLKNSNKKKKKLGKLNSQIIGKIQNQIFGNAL